MWFKKTFEEKQLEAMAKMQEEEIMKEIYKEVGKVYREQSKQYSRGGADKRDVVSALLEKGYPKWQVEKAVDYIFNF